MAIVKCCDYTHADKSVSAPTSEKIMENQMHAVQLLGSHVWRSVQRVQCQRRMLAKATLLNQKGVQYIPSQFRVMKNQPEIEFCEAEHLDAPDRGGTEVQGKQ